MFRLFDSLQSLIFKAQSRRVNIDHEKRHIILYRPSYGKLTFSLMMVVMATQPQPTSDRLITLDHNRASSAVNCITNHKYQH